MTDDASSRWEGGAGDDAPRFFLLSLVLGAACVLSWLLMGGAEMIAGVAERRGTAAAAALSGGGFAGLLAVLYASMRLFHWTWTRALDRGG